MEFKVSTFALFVEFSSKFRGEWLVTCFDGRLETIECLNPNHVRELERAVVVRQPCSLSIVDLNIYVGVHVTKLMILPLRRGAKFESHCIMNSVPVRINVQGTPKTFRKYRIDKYVEPFIVLKKIEDENEDYLDEDEIQAIYDDIRKKREEREKLRKEERNKNKGLVKARGKGGISRGRGANSRGRGVSRPKRGDTSEAGSSVELQNGHYSSSDGEEVTIKEKQREDAQIEQSVVEIQPVEAAQVTAVEGASEMSVPECREVEKIEIKYSLEDNPLDQKHLIANDGEDEATVFSDDPEVDEFDELIDDIFKSYRVSSYTFAESKDDIDSASKDNFNVKGIYTLERELRYVAANCFSYIREGKKKGLRYIGNAEVKSVLIMLSRNKENTLGYVFPLNTEEYSNKLSLNKEPE